LLTKAVASENLRPLAAEVLGGTFATIVARLLATSPRFSVIFRVVLLLVAALACSRMAYAKENGQRTGEKGTQLV
jgi:hypothetical protein